ncbi:hypothetical protein [Propionivibrio sp.]|uniref:hypothetical protein n=1 Tax=Propionivibrio sp. TaxID=2212460 RepID=UPI0025F833A4|nr:hypothetical protein [Propionivibrio sp.]MBK7356385.1 hypothetical protein [Propionivibrio sp.]
MTTYAAGLRVSEVCALHVSDIESAPDRMCLKVRQGQGAVRIAIRCSRPGCWRLCGCTGKPAGRVRGCSPTRPATVP